ncbi:MarR family winged helix-turn-helix transcriptional regulator [Pseudarthrobacter oxydans]|uniref:MarR family winged helix-turn-helix transcriptional regulator n=1 Tax=Pseudarthrobacter oxydans TaxID=1671 RepID=UPI003806CF24
MTNTKPSDNALADLADLVLNVAREIRLQVDESADVISLTPSEGNVMRFVDRSPGTSANGVATGTGLRRPNLSAALRGLEAKGLIRREPNQDDRREVRVFPTDRAALNLLRLREIWAERLQPALEQDAADVNSSIALLARLESHLIAGRSRAAGPHD